MLFQSRWLPCLEILHSKSATHSLYCLLSKPYPFSDSSVLSSSRAFGDSFPNPPSLWCLSTATLTVVTRTLNTLVSGTSTHISIKHDSHHCIYYLPRQDHTKDKNQSQSWKPLRLVEATSTNLECSRFYTPRILTPRAWTLPHGPSTELREKWSSLMTKEPHLSQSPIVSEKKVSPTTSRTSWVTVSNVVVLWTCKKTRQYHLTFCVHRTRISYLHIFSFWVTFPLSFQSFFLGAILV